MSGSPFHRGTIKSDGSEAEPAQLFRTSARHRLNRFNAPTEAHPPDEAALTRRFIHFCWRTCLESFAEGGLSVFIPYLDPDRFGQILEDVPEFFNIYLEDKPQVGSRPIATVCIDARRPEVRFPEGILGSLNRPSIVEEAMRERAKRWTREVDTTLQTFYGQDCPELGPSYAWAFDLSDMRDAFNASPASKLWTRPESHLERSGVTPAPVIRSTKGLTRR